MNPTNAVYFCNRAAAHSRLENHDNAIADCEEAVKLDPKYAKAYGRLGYTNFITVFKFTCYLLEIFLELPILV